MTGAAAQTPEASELDMLLGFLDRDPENVAMLADAADAALAARKPDIATSLLDRLAALGSIGPRERNLAGLAAMQTQRFDDAAGIFRALLDEGQDAPGLRFNFAWSAAAAGDFDGALQALDDATVDALPQAAMLKTQLLHQTERWEEAAAFARVAIARHPDDPGLMAAVSVLALDLEDSELARACAARAGEHPDALTTLGALALAEDDAAAARALFDRALAANRSASRAWIGRGLTKLLSGEQMAAGADIDRGAEMFGDHLGSWIAAGWAYFVAGDRTTARKRFETALEIDPAFAETQGSLAVLDVLDGRIAEARERATVALRLDRQSYSAALAQTLLAAGDGDRERARRIFETALTTPIDGSGRTIAQALARMGLS
ncbi:tetratricopeptide repeat protein [Sphingomonas sp. DT-204]|uniref:tetratricopeptide repeat protein n=1 Tax=Sphingomonas sp. DT-204 TaxID=3396166 RepID=UPI003F1D2A41